MSFGIWTRTVRDGEGNILPDAEIEVREVQDPADADAAPITKATIYEDFAGNTAKANPFTVDSDGRAEFYADGDFYHVLITVSGVTVEYLNQQLGTAQARDLVVGADGNVPAWDADGNLVDSGKAAADIGTGSGGTGVALDLGDDGTNESDAITEIRVANDTNGIFAEPVDDELRINVALNWPTADQADGLGSSALDDIGEIDASVRTGSDSTLVTGTAGVSGNLGEWNADGDLVDTGIASSAVFTQSSDVDHDSTTGFVANEHVDHSGVNVNAGDGLTGGGDLTATRTLSLDPAGATAETIAGDDDVLFGDTSNGGAVRRATAQEIADLGGGGAVVFEPPVSSEPATSEDIIQGPDDGQASGVANDGILLDDGRILLVPEGSDIYALDTDAESISVVETASVSTGDFKSGGLLSDGRAIFSPYDRGTIGLFDPSTDSYSDGPAHGETGSVFWGVASVTDGRAILAPHDSDNIGLFDPSDDSYTSGPAHGEGDAAFRGAVMLDDGRVMLAPYESSSIGLFDPSDDSYTSGPAHGEGSSAFAGAVKIDDGRVILSPWLSSSIGIFDPSDDSYTSGPAHGEGTLAFGAGSKASNGLVIFPPWDGDAWGVFDPSDDSFRTIAPLTTGQDLFWSSETDKTGRVWGVTEDNATYDYYQPAQTDAYAINFGEDVPDGYVAQGWFQPNETTTPTLRNTGGEPSTAIDIVNRDGSELAIGALDGAHRVYRDGASPDAWYLLDPVTLDPANLESGSADDGDVLTWDASADQWSPEAPSGGGGVDIEDDGAQVVADASAVNFGTNLTVTDDADGTVTVDAAASGGASELDELSDVTVTTPSEDDLLAYDAGSSEFINQSKSEAGFGDAATKGVTGADASAVTGTAGTAGNLGEWNADGDLIDTGIASSAIFTASSDVDHDATTNFVANEHINHSSVSINTGPGLSGGGDITSSRTLTIDIGSLIQVTAASTDSIVVEDASDTDNLKRVTAQSIADLASGTSVALDLDDDGANESSALTEIATTGDTNNIATEPTADKLLLDMSKNWPTADDVPDSAIDHDQTTNFVANEHVDHSSVTLTAGEGLTGGGDITTSRTFDVDIGGQTNVTAASSDEILIEDASDAANKKKVTAQSIADLGGGGGSTTWISKSTTYTASSGEKVLADTSGSTWTLTLPGTPSTGDFVKAADATGDWATNNLTVDGNGNNVEGAATFTANVDQGAFECIYNGIQWVVRFFTG